VPQRRKEEGNIPVFHGAGVKLLVGKVEFAPSTHPTTGGSYAANTIFE
jgi:hypothetical protein